MVLFNSDNSDNSDNSKPIADRLCDNAYDLIRNRRDYFEKLQHNPEVRDCPDALSFVACTIVGMCRQLWGYDGPTSKDEELAQLVYDLVSGADKLWRIYRQEGWKGAGFESAEHLAASVAIVKIADAWGTV